MYYYYPNIFCFYRVNVEECAALFALPAADYIQINRLYPLE